MEYDLHNSVLQKVAFNIQDISADTTTVGNIIDTLGFESIEFIVSAGPLNAGTYTVVLEDGDDSGLGDAAVIDSELVLGALPVIDEGVPDDNTAKRVGTITKKRFVRLSLVSAGSSLVNLLGSTAVLSNAHTRPTAAA